MEAFLSMLPLEPTDVLLTVHIPHLEPMRIDGSVRTNSRLLFESYRAAPRPLGNALPYLNATFLADISYNENGTYINRIKLAFGAYGTKHSMRARNVEEYLTGKLVSINTVNEAITLVKEAIVPEECTSHAAYTSSLAVGFLFEFLNGFSSIASSSNALSLEEAGKSINDGETYRMGNASLLSSAKQIVELTRDYHPVGEPIVKSGAAIQASGEAVYVDDIPSPPDCLHGAFVYSTKPLTRVLGVSLDSSQPTEVTAVITAKDIPERGQNIGALNLHDIDPLFADEISGCAGDLIAFVVAETQKSANRAAQAARVEFETEGLDRPILTVEEAVERSSFFHVHPYLYPKEVGDFSN